MVLVEEVSTEEAKQENKKIPLFLLLLVMALLGVLLWFLMEKVKRAQRRRKRTRPKMNL